MPRIDRYERLPFDDLGGGVDEGSPPNKAKFRVCENVRDSEGGTSKIKRPGLTKLDSVYDFGTKNVYGSFGIGEIDAVKQLALIEDDVQYETGGVWGSIFTPTDTIDVPVSVVKDKGLTIVAGYEKPITVLAGSAFYSGIAAPTALMEVHPEYPTTCDAEDFAAIADWAETQAGNMHASQATFGGKSCLRFLQGGAPNVADYSYVEKAYPLAGAAPGKRFCVKTSIYFDTFKHASKEKFYYMLFYSDTEYFAFSSDGYLLTINNLIPGRIGSVGIELEEDAWYDLEFYVDTEDGSCDVWITSDTPGGARKYYGNYKIDAVGAGTAGDATIYCSGHYVVSDVYLDYLNVYNTEESGEDGSVFAYGCTYRRGGNYPCESNPIESIIGPDFHYGTGLNDLTPGGTYSGTISRTIQIEIDGTGTPDTVKISYDGGITWSAEKVHLTTEMLLLYGVILTWGATTGHTSGDYWSFNCRVSSCRKYAGERTDITGIPTSSEGEVNQRRLWRTYADLAVYYWLVTLDDNTTTTYSDRHSDAQISGSDAVSYENYPPPEGGDIEIWDGRAWVTRVPEHPEALFYSRTGYLEQFPSPATSFFPLREDETDEVMKAVEYRNNLYAVKVNSIWMITRSGDSYLVDKIVSHTGTAAKGSVAVTDRGIIFLTNHYRIGICDGWKMIQARDLKRINNMVKKTLATINETYAYRSTAGHDPENKIYYLSIPTGSNEYPDTTIVFYYAEGEEKFFIDKYHQDITSISLTDVDQYQRELLLGTADGEIYKLNPDATMDDTTIISSKFRTGLIGNERFKRLRRMVLEHYVTSEVLIKDNFNDNNLTGWTTAGGVEASSQRLEVTIESGGADYIRKTFAAKSEVFAYFKLYISTLTTWANGNYIDTFSLGSSVCGVGIRNSAGTTKLRAWYKPDGVAVVDVSPDIEILTGSYHRIKVHWKAASAAAADDGIFKVWLDGILVVNITDCDTDTATTTQADFGNAVCSAGVEASLWLNDVKASIDKHINLKIFRDVQLEPVLEKAYPGQFPTGGDADLRKFMQRKIKLGIPGSFFSFEFSNNEVTSDWEVMGLVLYGRSRGLRKTVMPSIIEAGEE